ncbi:MAG TPA: hypothetical protein VK550_35085 [Polyangiaceae bacterium]|nr:hypothetical protein [Polyangiaceae bacterium]
MYSPDKIRERQAFYPFCETDLLRPDGREEAIAELQRDPYDPEALKADRDFVIKKLGLTESEFAAIMRAPVRPHDAYATDERLARTLLGTWHHSRGLLGRLRRSTA